VPRFLLDTNILSDFVRHPRGLVASRLGALGADEEACTSIVVAAELRYGAMKKKLPALSARIEEVLVVIDLLPLTSEADRHYGLLRTELETKGTPIGANDTFIAAHALATDCILVTDNVREFRRVRGLKVQNWLRP